MASQSLYRKWRSQTFDEFVGQESVIRTLKNALNSGTLAHAYLFTGPRGTGKTSTARLLAKAINCLHPQNGEPCNQCDQCREITAGNSFNVIEIDAASNRGIDSIRELRERVLMPPAAGKYKVYILDEAHMLTTEAFNALLKTLEEPPPHAIFVMATTDVHKMLPTVLSRCQRFDFKRFTMRQIVEHLKFVAAQEQVTLDQGAVELIARAASGGMRDALSLLDQAIAYSGSQISLSDVQSMLGVADPRAIQKFMIHIANLDSAAGLHLIHELAEAGADLRQINIQIAEYWRAMMLTKAGADIASIMDSTEDEVREISQTAQFFALEELTECARIFAQNDLVQKNQATPQLGLELALLSCIEIHRRAQSGQPALSAPAAPLVRSTPEPPRKPQAVPPPSRPLPTDAHREPPAVTPPPLPVEVVIPLATPPVSKEEEEEPEAPDWDTLSLDDEDLPEEITGEPQPAPTLVQPTVQEERSEVEADEESEDGLPALSVQDVKEKWEYIKRRIRTKKDGYKIAAFLNGYSIVGVQGTAEVATVLIKASGQVHYTSIESKPEYHGIIEWAMKVELGIECRVRILPPQASVGPVRIPRPASPAALDTDNRAANTTAAMPTRHSAYREPTPLSIKKPREEPASRQKTTPPSDTMLAERKTAPTNGTSLAEKAIVRENTTTAAARPAITPINSGSRLESAKTKAKDDPVVKKVAEMFKAEIREINLK